MYKCLTVIICLFFLPSFNVIAQVHDFSTKELADSFMQKQAALGKRTNLTVQKQQKQRYSVLLKGYKQWENAFKQTQSLEKQGFFNLEVVKDRYERGYSIIIHQSLNKKTIGQTFNQLRRMGIKNVKVHTDKIQLVRYIVMLHERPIKEPVPTIPAVKDVPVKQVIVSKKVPEKPVKPLADRVKKPDSISPAESIPEQPAVTEPTFIAQEEELNLDDDVMIIVMSDSSDITYEMSHEEGEVIADDDFEWAVDNITLETGLFTRSSSPVDHAEYINAAGHAKWQLSNYWEIQIAARLDGNYQHGDKASESDELDLDYGNNFLRYRDKSMRLTLGSDTVRWGKMDIFSPTDNVATLDMSRGVLYKWGEAYRSAAIVRSEFFIDNSKLDIVYLPYFREAELSDKKNAWYPVNFSEGAILGFGSSPLLKTLLKNGKIDDNVNKTDGGFGVRYSSSINSIDFDLTVQKIKLSAPYYEINPVIAANPSLVASQKYSLIEQHPRTWVIGGDMELQAGSVLLRFEAAWFSDLPATTNNFKYENYEGFKWAGGTEFYPGDSNTRINLQISGSHIDEKEKILDRDNIIALSGEVESLFDNNRWKLSSRFNIGLDEKDIYISPEIAYLGWEPFEFYSAIHYLEGDDNTLGGFFKENSMITFGWRGKY